MNRILAVVCLSGALLLLACGGDDDTDGEGPDGEGVAGTCSVSVTGAVTGSSACRATSLIHRADEDAFTFTLESEAGTPLTVLVGSRGAGRPGVSSRAGPSETLNCGVSVREGARAWFSEYSSPRTDEFLTGSCTLTFTELREDASSGGITTYRYRGTLRAHLLALERTGASGTVELDSSFNY